MKHILLLTFIFVSSYGVVWAQQERKFIREGNDLFEKQNFEKAEIEYRRAAEKNEKSFEASFNIADALYKQKKYEDALKIFTDLSKSEKDKEKLGAVYHNIGNTLLAMQKADESIEAYKESLRNNPRSENTKYNLEFDRQQKQQQNKDQQNKDQQNKDQQNKDQQNKDQQNKDQQNKDQQNKDQQNKDQQNKDQQNKDQNKNDKQQQQQQQKGRISKEDAERILESLQGNEKKVQEKVQKQKAEAQKAQKMKIEKNW